MALLHQSSAETVDSALDLFSLPPTQTSVENGMYVEFLPLSSLGPSATVEFAINQKGSSEFLDLANTYLYVKAKITKADESSLDEGAGVGPVNNWFHSLFSQVDLSLNNTLVTPSENIYPFRAYLERVLNFDSGAKQSQFTSEMFYADSSGHFEQVKGDENAGMKFRCSLTASSKEVAMYGRLHVDIMNTNRYLLNGVDVKLRLVKSKESFHLMAEGAGFKTSRSLTHVSLFVRKLRVNPSVQIPVNKALECTSARYPVKRVTIKSFSISRGNLGSTQDNLFLAQLHTRLLVCFVDSDAFNGNFTKNPFHFKHHNVCYVSLFLDGQQIPSSPLTPDFENNQFVRSYHRLFIELGLASTNEGNCLNMSDFAAAYCIFAFDLSPSPLDGDQIELIRSGSLRLELKFAKPLQEPIHVLMYGEVDSLIEIGRNREVVTDFTAFGIG
ncbi:uncharacterized protein F54H12.2-like [Aplysia californica]|uniref:Uncharacterized protein F54H12.2-like n=1 Tax=Aplysia californica TaxID=6500 RepID=A0ABM0JTZ3_APLCA|nr:uncharacterized protein F54H12.2-like [Aplysia californica]